jgi:hypothetical protein
MISKIWRNGDVQAPLSCDKWSGGSEGVDGAMG